MSNETIVAVFETGTRADAAVRALEAAGVPSNAIERHSRQEGRAAAGESETRSAAAPSTGFLFWDMMMGPQTSHQDRPHFERSIERGETVVAVTVSTRDADNVIGVLEEYSPAELDEQFEEHHTAQTSRTGNTAGESTGGSAVEERAEREEVIPLAEEELRVGKRTVNRGKARVRRYVVETPVEREVSLRDERVVLEKRRPATDEVRGDVFSEKTVEVTETAEVPEVEKVARLKEEVVVRKQGTERTETVEDTVRRDQIAVEEADETAAPRRRSNA